MQSGALGHVAELRAAIARIEGGREAATARGSVRLGENLALDAAIGGGIAMGTLNEILPASSGDTAAACAFALALAVRMACQHGLWVKSLIWIIEDFAAQEHGAPYGPGLAQHGIAPEKLVIVKVPRRQDALWALETALKVKNTLVIGELWAQHGFYDLTASRRLALAARASGSPGLIIHSGAAGREPASAASLRLEITGHASTLEASAANRTPLPGPPAFAVRVARARAGPMRRAHDADRRHVVVWDGTRGCFCDALSLCSFAEPGNRPRPAADAGQWLAKTA